MTSPAPHPIALELAGIKKSFGATRALRGVSLAVTRGEVHALIGENGAGKSTLMKILSGVHQPDAGSMVLEGEPFAPADPHDARHRGVAMIYQELNLALHLSVQENILLGAESASLGWIDRAASRERARAALAQLGHDTLELDRPAGSYSIAIQQVIEIARALLRRPKVLIMDEPTSSLSHADSEKLFETILRLRAQGVSIIYISHFLEECRRVADRFTVLKDGETVGHGEMRSANLTHIVTLMTGREVKDLYARKSHQPGDVVLEVQDIMLTRFADPSPVGPALAAVPSSSFAEPTEDRRDPHENGDGLPARRNPLRPVSSFKLRAGEIFGLAGLIGAGRTELLRVMFGLDDAAAGDVCVVPAPAAARTPRARWSQGVGFLSENRKEEGLMLSQPLADNLTLTKLGRFGRFGWISRGRQRATAQRWIESLAVKCRDASQPIAELSGGNQQKIALARLLEHPARIFLLDEPTRGIDVGSKAQIYEWIGDLAARGRAVVIVSSYLPELLGLCDTIGVMCRGELCAVRPRQEWTEPEIMRVATGSAGSA